MKIPQRWILAFRATFAKQKTKTQFGLPKNRKAAPLRARLFNIQYQVPMQRNLTDWR
jgi:hypothetical protein|tara:strand:+ start:171 stop:341 length:171 start_codon:yes stop_codon:yes gene_type:complete